jgi:hypothetical protein
LFISQSMVMADFNQRALRQFAAAHQLFRIAERNHIIIATMQNYAVGFKLADRSPVLPRRAQKNERSICGINIERNCTSAGGADNDVRTDLIVCGLSTFLCSVKVIVIKLRIDDIMTMASEIRRFHSTRDGTPTMKEENFHEAVKSWTAALGSIICGFKGIRSTR